MSAKCFSRDNLNPHFCNSLHRVFINNAIACIDQTETGDLIAARAELEI